MTLRDLIDAAEREEVDALLTLRQVAEVTGTPYETIRRWVYTEKVLPTVPYGPHRHKRVMASVVLQMFCPHRPARRKTEEPRPVRTVPSPYRPCNGSV